MPEMITIAKAEWENLEERAKKLAVDKSYLQLIIRLMSKINAIPGLDNTVENMLRNIVDVIGGTNIILYYVIDQDVYYADVYGERKKLAEITDGLVQEVMKTRQPMEFEHEFGDTQMMTPEFSKAYTWIVPLVVGSELIGVFKMENLNIAIRDLYQQLPVFFAYAALVLRNEIMGHTRLQQAHDRLEREVVVRQQVEEQLRRANEALEIKVAERTAELQNANERLLENENRIEAMLEKSEKSRLALLSILEDEKQAQAALRSERALLSRIMETSPVGITVVNRAGQIIFANPQSQQVLGLTQNAITQRTYNEPIWRITDYAGAPFPDEQLPFQRVMSTRQPVHDIQHAIVWPDGHRVLLSINGAPLLNQAGGIESVVCTIEDVTERKQAEVALQRVNRELRAISNCNQTLLRAEDEKTLLNEICRIVYEEAGYHMAWVGFAENDDAKTVRPVAWAGNEAGYLANAQITWANTERGRGPTGRAIRSGQSASIQDFFTDPYIALWRQDALQRGYRSSIALPLKDDQGNAFGALTIYSTEPNAFTPGEIRLLEELSGDLAFGITVLRARAERKQAEVDLRISDARYRMAQAMGHVGNWEYNLQTTHFWGSDEAKRIYGFDPSQPDFSTDDVENCITERERVHQALVDLIEAGKPYDLEFEIYPRNASEPKIIASLAQLQYDEHCQPLKVVGVIQDITERKRAEEEIRSLNQELEKRVADRTAALVTANKELEAFAYSVSHDLRAPLRHIGGFLEILKESASATMDEESLHYMDIISNSAKRMSVMIDDLLSFSRMSRSEMSKAQVDLGQLVQDVIQEFELETANRDVEWKVSPLPEIVGDRAMLRLVLENLISNALKFTRSRMPAKIEIGWMPDPEAEKIIFIRDNGVGFDMQYADKLFGVFQRLHRANEFEGTGIGLANVRRIIERHGGRTWAEAQPDQGATFYFSFPAAPG
jgi:PAS domain S-box-containing protein